MSVGFAIRAARISDLEAILAFDPLAPSSAERIAFLRRSVANDRGWVAEIGSAVVAFAILDRSFFEQYFIPLVFVHANFRRQQLATKLLLHLERQCDGLKLFTSANQSNVAMRRLLTQLDFTEAGIVHGLDESDPEIVYLKRVESSRPVIA
jgi:GNAT superfamily N-acetyltransferase